MKIEELLLKAVDVGEAKWREGECLENGCACWTEHVKAAIKEVLGPAVSASPQPEKLAQLFHETYERLAPQFGYETRKESAKAWLDIPPNNRRLMIAVCAEMSQFFAAAPAQEPRLEYAVPDGFIPNDEPDEEHMATKYPCSCDLVTCSECGPRIAERVVAQEQPVENSPQKGNDA